MKTSTIRPPAVAGMFYPASASRLRADIRTYIEQGCSFESPHPPKAIIGPHAGYIYSGPIAGSAYAGMTSLRPTVTRVILLGPSHRVSFKGIACTNASAFRTPLGDIPVDHDCCDHIRDFPFVVSFDDAHKNEHGLEVHLPFLQETFDAFAVVPLVVGDATGEQAASVIARLWGGDETLVVVSSDLSHYLPYDEARRVDRATSDAIERLRPGEIEFHHACGRIPVQGLLIEAVRHGLQAITIDLRNSGDTAGNKDQVVGYGAYAFTE